MPDVPNQLLQARKAVELASHSGLRPTSVRGAIAVKEQEYAQEALTQARTFLARAEKWYQKDQATEEVIQFARTAAQSAENARALATGAVGGLMVHQMERELADLRKELATLRGASATLSTPFSVPSSDPAPAATPVADPAAPSVGNRMRTLVAQPSLWFAMSGWVLAVALLLRRRTI
jgi:hypothetical protein